MDMLKNFSLLGGSLGVASLGAGIFEVWTMKPIKSS